MRYFFPINRYRSLERGRLVESVLAGGPALVLLWAGAGAGKSTIAAQVAARLAESTEAPAVWVRFGGGQPGAPGAWQSILTALLEAGLIPSDSRAARLHDGDLAHGVAGILDAVGEDVPERLTLVLDDVHLVSDAEFETSLLEALASKPGLRAVLCSRSRLRRLVDVEARMRLPVREVAADELELTPEEVGELVRLRLPRLDEAEQLGLASAISRNAAVWPMVAHAAIVEYDAAGRAPDLTQRELVERHVDRLLEAGSEQHREMLCATALFSDVSAPVVSEILDIEPSRAAAMLEDVSRSSAGCWEEADGTRWYRHHDLVREELLRRAETELGREHLRLLHRRACSAFEGRRPAAAVQAALQAEAWEPLQQLLLMHGFQRAVRRDERADGRRLRDIPASARERYPVLAAFALIDEYAFPRGRFERVLSSFKALTGSQLAAESAKAGLPGAVASAFRMVAARLSGNETLAGRMAARFEEAVDQLDEQEAEQMWRPLQTGVAQAAVTHLHAARFDAVDRVLQRIDPGPGDEATLASAHVLALRAFSDAWRGWIPEARTALEDCEDRQLPDGWRDTYSGSGYRIAGTVCALESDELDEAERHLDALAEHEPTIEHWPYLAMLRALISDRRSGPRAALTGFEWQMSARRRRFALLPQHRRSLAELRARLRWHAGLELPRESRREKSLVGAYALLAAEAHDAARGVLGAMQQDDPEAGGVPRRRAEILVLQAESARRGGDSEAAGRFGALAAETMQRHGMRLPARVLPAADLHALAALVPELGPWSAAQQTEPVPAISALTRAERRALLAVAEHGSTADAAQALYLSRETVKWHLARVYRKLGVRGRGAAVRVAADAGLLGSGTVDDPGRHGPDAGDGLRDDRGRRAS